MSQDVPEGGLEIVFDHGVSDERNLLLDSKLETRLQYLQLNSSS
jgi:hypothetical protein